MGFSASSPQDHCWGARRTGPEDWSIALWAPSVADVRLVLPDIGEDIGLVRASDGVHRGTARAAEGCRYGFKVDGKVHADPASIQQEKGVEGWSILRDPDSFRGKPARWAGRAFDEAVFAEVHVGSFTREGTLAAAQRSAELRRLAELGVTAIELMPLGQFPGRRGWGYDSVLPWAVHHEYGTPEDLAQLVDEAHRLGLMVFLDVVFNHFGPQGCALAEICPEFFLDERNDWGRKIDFRRPEVRAYFTGCALHWLGAYGLDGLRLDAAHSMEDPSDTHIVVELARHVRAQDWPHPVHLVAEDSSNKVGWYGAPVPVLDATWDDDYHHALHVMLTGETFGYYKDFARDAQADLCRALRDGQALQGQPRPAGQERKGEPSAHVPPHRFINFNLNHDHAGNRPKGERLISLIGADRALVAHGLLLAAPYTPLVFMGEEIGSRRPFPWFADYAGKVARKMREGRVKQFADLPGRGEDMIDPFDPATLRMCWPYALPWPGDADLWQSVTRSVLTLRREVLIPLFRSGRNGEADILARPNGGLTAHWHFHAGTLRADVSFSGEQGEPQTPGDYRPLYALGHPEAPHLRLGLVG